MVVTSAFAQTRELQIYKSGSIIQSYPVAYIDSLKVGYSLASPISVNAQLNDKSIVVSWPAVTGATSYQVYRSGDNKTYSLLATGIRKTSYTDSSPLKGTNYYKVKATGEDIESVLSVASSLVSYNDDNGLATGLYMGIIGFNEDLIDKGFMTPLASNTKSTFTSFVNSLTTKKNTVLYYAVDKALDKLTTTPFPNNLRNVAIVTFTDGLDQGSLPMINYDPYVSKAEYRTYLDGRIKSTMVQGLSLSAYTIGVRGGDVTNVQEFQNNLVSLASSEENATEVSNMTEVNSRFQEIANQLTDITETQTISIKFPMLDDGQTFRFTFDNVSSAALSQCYIEGTMNVRNNTLNNIHYVGLTCSSGTSIQGTRYGINISFDFVDLKDAKGRNLSLDYVKEYYLDGTYWQVNSEFDRGDDIQVTVERSSAAIMLVLDCSSSLQSDGDKFTEMKTHAKSFIETLAAAMGEVHMVTGITLNQSTMTIYPGDTGQLIATISPADASDKSVIWTSSSTSIATVDQTGKVTAVAAGSCTITATAADGSGVKAECAVTVTQLVTSITLSQTSLTLTLPSNTTKSLTAIVSPTNATNKGVTWSSSSKRIATVAQTGIVTAVAEGTCTITCTAKDGSGVKATCVVTVEDNTHGNIDGHEYVDLGLPSGTLWATCNIGATKPEGYGNYYAWGETTTKSNYDWSTYKLCKGSKNTMTKYCTHSSYGTVDNKTELDSADDAATVNWGSNWQMPSLAQFQELINSNYTTTTWTTQNGFYGREITSKINGNSIFLPATGWRNGASLNEAGTYGYYWSRSLSTSGSELACDLDTYSRNIQVSEFSSRNYGLSVRPVCVQK